MTLRIALIHAVAVAIAPVEEAFQRLWPEAERMNVLDDTLAVDRALTAELTPEMTARICALADYAVKNGANGVQFTCSAFGAAIDAAARQQACPVLKPNAAMFEDALACGNRIGMVATFEPSVARMRAEFEEAAAEAGRDAAKIEILCVPDAMLALRAGDVTRHNGLVSEAAKRLTHRDAIMLAQFSTSVAAGTCRAAIDVPILTSPDAAVLKLKGILARTST
jgi:hypothetical protein